ncbi:hypothetical protein GCM10020220_107380 [Nonomuraea rubra]
MRTPTNTDTTSEDVNRLTLIADATQSKDRRADNTRVGAAVRGNSGKRLGPRSSDGGRSHLRLVPSPRAADEPDTIVPPPPGRGKRRQGRGDGDDTVAGRRSGAKGGGTRGWERRG